MPKIKTNGGMKASRPTSCQQPEMPVGRLDPSRRSSQCKQPPSTNCLGAVFVRLIGGLQGGKKACKTRKGCNCIHERTQRT